MRDYNLGFIDNQSIFDYTKKYVSKYRKSINMEEFNSNIIDPIKLTFDSKIYGKSIEETIIDECMRQLDKSNSNVLGYFHQNIFSLFAKDGWEVPQQGFDVINKSRHIYVEMKNKHNTMNAASSRDTFLVLQNQAVKDSEAQCMLVEVIAKESQCKKWEGKFKGHPLSHDRVWRVSIDKFYEIAFNQKDAFFRLCEQLPNIIDDILQETGCIEVTNTVIQELYSKYSQLPYRVSNDGHLEDVDYNTNYNKSNKILKQLYLLAFNTYEGFERFKK